MAEAMDNCAQPGNVQIPSGESQAVMTGRPLDGPAFEDRKSFESTVDISELVDTSKVIEVEKIDVSTFPKKRVYFFLKRLFDIVSCSIAVVILAIPMCIIAILIKKDSPGPVFYKQERLGKNGKPFMLIKFRSMYTDAEARGAQWAQDDDPRVTPIGKKLRATRADELPQFFQVITGKLTLIGPRPERKVFYDEFEKYIHGFSQRLAVKPGVSGLAQVSGGYNLKPAEKVVYDIDYIKNCSVGLDLKIIFKTLKIVLTHEGAR